MLSRRCRRPLDAIVEPLGRTAQGGEVVCVFSNGGFGGIHGKLLERLRFKR
jgi:UDP-N-acetylmuramate: L-alanyl-gamma-D-glutamyl-meso-diaminopimelate ligase